LLIRKLLLPLIINLNNMFAKRIFDVFFSLWGIIFILPLLLFISVIIQLDSKGGVIYKQVRVGRNKAVFNLLKFRTMRIGSDKDSLLTIGDHDVRITRFGHFLRKYKLDELPQLINILKGDMSFVGPRPEVSKYVALYNHVQMRILTVKPGLTDWASIDYIDESKLLAQSKNPEAFYIEHIIPLKVAQNLRYIDNNNLWIDIKIILLTLKSILNK
jgi:lipopolysaccharide/colanic/teichoic acid biosynthesis glycosyltransferase